MMLSDREILQYMEDQLLEIKPFNRAALGTNSVDLTLDKTLLVYKESVLDSRKVNAYDYVTIPISGFTLRPGELYLGSTREYTDTPATSKLVPQLEGKSSVARLGICVHLTAGFGDCGFKGHWTLEITCVKPVVIYTGMPIAQIFYMQCTSHPLVPYDGKESAKYSDQRNGPVASKMWANDF